MAESEEMEVAVTSGGAVLCKDGDIQCPFYISKSAEKWMCYFRRSE